MGQLHELLAVEDDKKSKLFESYNSIGKLFNKSDVFDKQLVIFHPKGEKEEDSIEGSKEMENILRDEISSTLIDWEKYLDLLVQKEATNTEAKASIELNGKAIAVGVPVTGLLAIERELKQLKNNMKDLPVFDSSIPWEKSDNLLITSSTRERTQKIRDHKVVVPATDRHPAQMVEISKDEVIGKVETKKWTSKWSQSQKKVFLRRIDTLIEATKKARMRANKQEIITKKVAGDLVKFLLEAEEINGRSGLVSDLDMH